MAAKKDELQNRLLDIIEGNTKALERTIQLLDEALKSRCTPKQSAPLPDPTSDKDEPKTTEVTNSEITPDQIRKGLQDVMAKSGKNKALEVLEQYGKARTVPDVKKENFPALWDALCATLEE